MGRLFSHLLAAIGLTLSGPVAAQSLGLVQLPVVFVGKPVVQPLLGATDAAETIAAPQGAVGTQNLALPTQLERPAHAPRAYRQPTIDRSVRDYRRGIAQYGPFRVIDAHRVALVGETDASTPRWFRVMLRRHPELRQLDMVECPGTQDDIANMRVGRAIRAAGIATHVPPTGSVRSGAVELFLAGAVRDIADGAEFAVHSWMDEYGREADDFSLDAPQNRQYLAYYREMGMSAGQAREFYAFTNSVPHHDALWLEAHDMRRWVGQNRVVPQIAFAGP